MTRLSKNLFLAVLLCGCGGKATTRPVTPPAVRAPAPAATAKPVTVSPSIDASEELATKCKLRFANVENAPKFDLDQAQLSSADRGILEQVAECLLRGPLQGRSVQVLGRADPCGTDEYNLGLGARRAETVRSFLERLGVPSTRLAAATCGEIDAAGTDELGWQRDRRVDLQLAN